MAPSSRRLKHKRNAAYATVWLRPKTALCDSLDIVPKAALAAYERRLRLAPDFINHSPRNMNETMPAVPVPHNPAIRS